MRHGHIVNSDSNTPCKHCSKHVYAAQSMMDYRPIIEGEYDISVFISDVVGKLSPSAIVINQGFWLVHSRNSLISRVLNASRSAVGTGGQLFWKTTTATRDAPGTPHDNDEFLSRLLLDRSRPEIFDAYNLTAGLNGTASAYWDQVHFNPFVYRELNRALIDRLCTVLN